MFEQVVQIAGIIDQPEADLLPAAGVDLLGFPLRLTVHKEDLSETAAVEIIHRLTDKTQAVLITYLANAEEIIAFCDKLGATIVQLHGPVALAELRKIKKKRPDIKVIKSLVVREDNRPQLYQDIETFGNVVDAFITDTFDPESGASGATGKTHDWTVSRELVEHSPKPVILAGGLTPDNVYDAILTVRPDGVDAHTGVESSDGRKDVEKVRRFVAEARRAFADMQNIGALKIPINGILDLHTFHPKEVKELVPDYLAACREKGIFCVRIIHGKGTGTLRKIVQSILSRMPEVESFHTAEGTGGGWGATSVVLRRAGVHGKAE